MTVLDALVPLQVLKRPPSDIAPYAEALADIPADVLSAAVSHLLRSAEYFPVPAEVRAACDHVARPTASLADAENRETALDAPFTVELPGVGTITQVTREWRYYCERCSDTGWASWWCGATPQSPWMGLSACERRQAHAQHEWVGHCACWESNPDLVRKRAHQRTYAKEPVHVERKGRF